jgi:putative ABC transport system permease protein
VIQDIRYAIRVLFRQAGFSAVVVATLAIGIGATTAIFSVVNGVLLRRLPYAEPDRLVRLLVTTPNAPRGSGGGAHSAGNYRDMKREVRTLERVAAYRPDGFDLSRQGSEPQRLEGAQVTAGFFDVFGMAAVAGRTFREDLDRPGDRAIVLSEGLWRRLGADARLIGSPLRINGQSQTVLGVMPDGFRWPDGAEIWSLAPTDVPTSPVDLPDDERANRDVNYFDVMARLRPDATLDQAQADLTAVAEGLAARFPDSNQGRGYLVAPLHEQIVGNVRPALLVLMGAVAFVLLIACANVANLLLARASSRRREIGIRASLGAGRLRIVRQLLTESVLLGLVGGAFGLLVAAWGLDLLLALVPEGLPRAHEVRLDARVMTFTAAVSILTGLLFGLAPAIQTSRDLTVALKEGARSIAGARRGVARAVLLVAEVALALVLLVGAGLLVNSFIRLQRVDPGYITEHVVAIEFMLPQGRFATDPDRIRLLDGLLTRLRAAPATSTAGAIFPMPFSGSSGSADLVIEGRSSLPRQERPLVALSSVTPGLFQTLGIPIVRGRDIAAQDTKEAPGVAVISDLMARRFWPGEDPIGRRINLGTDDGDWITIVGVVGDVRPRSLAEPPAPTVYLSFQQFTVPFMGLVVRSMAPPAAIVRNVRAELRAIDPDLPLGEARALQEIVSRSLAQPRFRTVLLAGFAAVSLLLAAIGVYGLVSYSVTERVPELGVRLALGATPAQILKMVVGEGLRLSAVGVVLGVASAAALTRVLASLLYDVAPTDLVTFTLVSGLLVAAALTASYIPARRATRIDPLAALRAE